MSSIPFTKVISWDEYMQHRPPYPDSMWKLWFDYHKGPLETVHDVGAGGGVASHDIARRTDVKRIYVSDPGKEHLAFAEEMLRAHHDTVDFIFRNTIAEQTLLDDSSVDLVCCCEALHWVDVSKGMPVMAKSLRAGGTFAAVYYLPFPQIRNSAKAQAAQTKLLDDFGKNTPDSAVQHPAWRRGFSQSNVGLDFVPFDEETWQDLRRIEINISNEGWPSSSLIAGRFGRVHDYAEGFAKERWEDDEWKKTMSAEELRQLLKKFLGAPDILWESEEWKTVLQGAEEVDDRLEVAFQAAIVLARKK
ncbi:S-adenosyl-L-methionine-dependent methyltransferase [Emericellopsis atlantica]|uniref:S-adenosyl-L-methionine-dependent methyltransferase n=1 Tax=Emericellopsis atlantica TaxID=2614577 RepID=A0A9P8CWB2_9HYPO|nr:S-adenosyl-L-methionine-dependent methyltransferase [Emericellopsis atlantica]KAG9258511.1 S-adenosyl-L-methionine-dependent methyltransferase [Emericellopsis atlantica]